MAAVKTRAKKNDVPTAEAQGGITQPSSTEEEKPKTPSKAANKNNANESDIREVDTDEVRARIHKLSQSDLHIKMLLYGDPGAGKTFVAGTAPKVLLALTEEHVSKPTLYKVRKMFGYDPDVFTIDTFDDVVELYTLLKYGDTGHETLVLDSVLDMERRLIEKILAGAVKRRADKDAIHDPDILDLGDWNRVSEVMRRIIRQFRDLPMDVVMTTLIMDDKQDSVYRPFIQPKTFAREFAAYFNTVCYIRTERQGEDEKHIMQTTGDGLYICKNPGGVMPYEMVNPDLSKIFPAIRKALQRLSKED